jgi:predicted CopG family antitoxin
MVETKSEQPTIRINKTTWIELNRLKQPGESFGEVIDKLLEQLKDHIQPTKEEK